MGAGSLRDPAEGPVISPIYGALLGLIIERPSYAYELAQRFERTYGDALALSSVSHMYMALPALRKRGLIEEASCPGGSRRIYRATELGVSEHARWLTSQIAEERRQQRVLITQLGALARAPGRALEALDQYERECLSEIADAPGAGEHEGLGATRLVARLTEEETRLTLAARLRWTQYARAQLDAMPPLDPPARATT
jgi:DNA-binding PadR family transcriptional regulator